MDRPGALAHDDQARDARPAGQSAHLLVLGGGRRAELEHLAEHGPGPPPARHRRQRRQRGPHRVGVGVVGVVDDGDPVGALDHLHPPPAARHGGAQRGGQSGRGGPQLERDGGGGQRVGDVVLAVQRQGDLGRLPVAGAQQEASAGRRRRAGPARPVRRRPRRGRTAPPARTSAGHRGDQRVVGVEHGDSPGGRVGQRRDQLALGPGDRLRRAELADVRGADVEHHADLRRRDPAQLGDVADPAGAHLDAPGTGSPARRPARSAARRSRC